MSERAEEPYDGCMVVDSVAKTLQFPQKNVLVCSSCGARSDATGPQPCPNVRQNA